MNREDNHNLEILITRSLAGETSAEEERQLRAWIAENPDNQRHYQGFKKVFELSQRHVAREAYEPLDVNIDREWDHFVSGIRDSRKKVVPLTSSRVWLRIAAAVLLLVVSGAVIRYFVSGNRDLHFQTSETTLALSLPDGSKVILNRNSELAYSRNFGQENREVRLTGEGYFDVAPNRQKPFVILSGDARVEVVGTSFNVKAYHDLNEVEVVVQTGVVTFSVPEGQQAVRLNPGQKGIYSRESHHLSSTTNEDINFLSWNTHKVIFNRDDLRTVVETLNKTYDAKIVITADVPATCLVTVTFDHQTLEAVLRVLQTTLNLTYQTVGQRTEITHAGC